MPRSPLLCLVLLFACTGTTPADPTPDPSAAVGKTGSSLGPAHRCATDGDCVTTCEYGTVNREWFEARPPTDCGGGCTNPGAQAPRCEQARCVAYRDGKPHAACTEQPVPD